MRNRKAYPASRWSVGTPQIIGMDAYVPLTIQFVRDELDRRVRLAAFQWLRSQMDVHGEVLPRLVLAEGFVFDGRRVPLLGPQGIFKPALCGAPLSITTIPGQYPDGMGGGTLAYAYRGTDPAHPDNRGLRRAMQAQLPLVCSPIAIAWRSATRPFEVDVGPSSWVTAASGRGWPSRARRGTDRCS